MTMRTFHFTYATGALALVLFGIGLAPTVEAKSAERACWTDFTRFCKGITPGDGRVLVCLYEHQDQVSADCKASLDTSQDCVNQARQLCGSTAEGKAPDRMIMRQCLREALSTSCRPQLTGR